MVIFNIKGDLMAWVEEDKNGRKSRMKAHQPSFCHIHCSGKGKVKKKGGERNLLKDLDSIIFSKKSRS